MALEKGTCPARTRETETDAWYRAIVDSSLDAIIGKRLDGTIISWNPAAERIYGYRADEVLGRHISLLVPAEKLGELEQILRDLHRGEGVRGRETERLRKDGRRIDVSLTISPVSDASGRVVGGSVVARDITEMKRTQKELRESRERLSVAVRAADIGLFRWESESDDLLWDETMRAIFGVRDGREITSLADFLDMVHPDDRASVAADARQSIQDGTEYSREYRILLPDGAIRWIAAKARPFSDAAGKAPYLTGACRDVTGRRETQEALAAAVEQKELLLREINHRVKNSLQLASSLLQVQGASAGSEPVRRALMEASRRLITVARVHERLYQGTDVQMVELRDYLEHLCNDIRNSTATGNTVLSVEVENLALGADKAILIGLLVNELVTNAVKHASPHGRGCEVRVECRRAGGGFLLSVADTGQGLPPGFDVQDSTSFGMRLINAFTRQLGGVLDVTSSAAGTRFAIQIRSDGFRSG